MNKKTLQPKVKVSRLYLIAEQFRKIITDEEEVENIDRTEEFMYELAKIIESGELITININARVRQGKSVLAMSIAKYIHELLKEFKHKNKKEPFGVKNICRDQQEYSKRMRDPEISFDVLVIDEVNELENTGENSTVERALNKVINDVQAVRYVHTVWCSPKDRSQNNADIMLSVIGKDKKTMTTHAKLYYRYFEGGQEYEQLLGYIRWPVKDVIGNWEKNVKGIFFNKNRSQEEEDFLRDQMRKDWFVDYNVRKSEKIDMLTKEGIFRPRTLEYAEVILKVVEKLKKISGIRGLLNANIVRNYIKIECKEDKIPLSIVGEELATRETMGLLDLYKNLHALKQKKNKLLEKGDTTQAPLVIETLREVARAINLQEDEYKKLIEINRKYNLEASK